MPFKVNQTGVLMDAAKVILNPFNRNYNLEVQKHWQILTGYEGSYWEHNLFELWIRLPSISAVKALEIANVEGIPIYLIDSGNIGQIMPLLELPADLKEEIQNSVNVGMEVKVSKREIQFIDWYGVGYLVRDPQAGAGAYKISGGYAGGGSGSGNPTSNGSITWAWWTNKRRASVCLGDIVTLPPPLTPLEELAIMDWIDCYRVWIRLFALKYLPSFSRVNTIDKFTAQLTKAYNRVFYFNGHASPGESPVVLVLDSKNPFTLEDDIVVSRIDIRNTPKPEYLFVFINNCKSETIVPEFGSKSGLAWTLLVPGLKVWLASYLFWEACQFGITVEQARQIVVLHPLIGENDLITIGEGSVRLLFD
jgi:hypothetical protein